jgi:hypothetical protein
MGYPDEVVVGAFGPTDTPYYMNEDDLEIRKHIFDLLHDQEKIDKFIETDDGDYKTDENDNEN